MYIARQPIFNRNLDVYGYELLYRIHETSTGFSNATPISSTATILGGLFELGVTELVGNRKAFVNFDDEFLLSYGIELIDPDSMVIEVLENSVVSDALIERLKHLKTLGYKIALDDFEQDILCYPLVELADIIKFDILLTPLDQIIEQVKYAKQKDKILLAEKIETREEYITAKEMGFHLFQGYFFSKPTIVGSLKSQKNNLTVYHRLLNELKKKEPSFQILTEIIETDVDTAYRLIKATSKEEADSRTIKNALTSMGLTELERWINILLLQNLSTHKPKELLRLSMVRSKFGELLATKSCFDHRKHEVSLMCLFSILDAVLDCSMEDALKDISITDDVKDALLKDTGVFSPLFEIILCYERGNCESVCSQAHILHIPSELIPSLYIEAIKWADKNMRDFSFDL